MLRRRLEQRIPTVGLHLIATNRYVQFLPKILESVNKYFFPTLNRHIIIYTDQSLLMLPRNYEGMQFHFIPIQHEGWPYVTLKRFHYFSMFNEPLDYSFYCDVDSVFIKTVSADRLTNELMGTIHPGFVSIEEERVIASGKGTVCTNEASTAYIPFNENKVYFCGGFFGGPHSKFMQLTAELKQRIQTDMNNNVMADWHDESHLNWYFWKNPPTVLQFPFAQQEPLYTFYLDDCCLVFLNKSVRGGHDEFRKNTPPPTQRLKFTGLGFKRY
jgi:hypothetical protein